MPDVLIIGGGAAGLTAAIAAAMHGDRVTVLERMDRVGKKILATGNGRCNLMNVGRPCYPGGTALAQSVLDRCGVEEQTAFWHHLGLRLRVEDGGRVYPVSGQASSVLDSLRLALDAYGVEVITGVHVEDITRGKRGFNVIGAGNRWTADRVIIAGGGCAQPKLGSNGSTWKLLKCAGHHIVEPKPCLTQIVTDTAPIRGLSGIRVRCKLRIKDGSRMLHEESGEALFADYGVSGVCAMQCARYVYPGCSLHMDFAQGMGFQDAEGLRQELFRRRKVWGSLPVEALLTGLCVPRLSQAFLHAAEIPMRGVCVQLTNKQLDAVVRKMMDFPLEVRGVKGFDSAQVSSGGAACSEFRPDTLESIRCPGLHAAGEVLDVDGDCGGFNLMFAFGSGILAGLNGRNMPWR